MQVEYEAIRVGHRLRHVPSPGFSWRDLLVVVVNAPDDSPLRRVMSDCGHSSAEHIALIQQHSLDVANWQRGSGKARDRPKPLTCLLPPDQRPEVTRFGDAQMTLEETADWIGWSLPAA